jgi:ABC-type nitrate/sulfonate/bicarbonate transport system substrate-binding protein
MHRRTLMTAAAGSLCFARGQSARAADKVRVGMLKPNIVTVLYWIAVRTGSFDKNGIAIQEFPVPSGQTAAGIEQLLRGDTDFYLGASGEVAHLDSHAIEMGHTSPISIIETSGYSGSFIVLRPDLKGKSLDELRGMKLRIAISNPSSYHLILLRAYLSSRKMTTDDLKWMFLTTGAQEMLPALMSRQIDGFMHDCLTTTLAIRDKAGFIFMSSDAGDMGEVAKNVPGTSICGSQAFISAHPDVTRRFVQSLRDGSAAYDKASKPEMVTIMAEWSRQDPAVIDALYDRFNPRTTLSAATAKAWWDVLGGAMLSRGEISPKLSMNNVFDLSFV